jgi:hypothetical protein
MPDNARENKDKKCKHMDNLKTGRPCGHEICSRCPVAEYTVAGDIKHTVKKVKKVIRRK